MKEDTIVLESSERKAKEKYRNSAQLDFIFIAIFFVIFLNFP